MPSLGQLPALSLLWFSAMSDLLSEPQFFPDQFDCTQKVFRFSQYWNMDRRKGHSFLFVFLLIESPTSDIIGSMTTLTLEPLTILGSPLGPENPLPFFRDPALHLPIQALESLPPEKRHLLGWETAFRVLPYRMQDQYSRQRQPLTFRSIVLENEILKAIFLPELGGRLISLFHKPLGKELLHRNPVFQPANLAIRNAWFSGGVEWNLGQFGHSVNTCSPVFASRIQGAQGEPGLRLYEFERTKRLFWQIDFYLPPSSPFLLAYTRVVNPNPYESSMYWWTNIAVNEAEGVRVLSPASHAVYIAQGEGSSASGHAFGQTMLPGLPSLKGADGTYSLNHTFANEFFFQCDQTDMPWEAALDRQGRGFVEASTCRLSYRKLFCWGQHAGGKHWQEYLSEPGQAYIEIQGGLAPTQVHGLIVPSHAAWDWTQVFGALEADPNGVHSPDWANAVGTVEAALQARLPTSRLYQMEETFRSLADLPSPEILQSGSGWGALELKRREKGQESYQVPASFVFPSASFGPEQAKWAAMLEGGVIPEPHPNDLPGEWLVQPEWQRLLEASIEQGGSRSWYTLLHLGVMRLENLDEAGAESAWEESLRLRPSAWAYRNLAVLRQRQKKPVDALDLYGQAWQLAGGSEPLQSAMADEYLLLLFDRRLFERGWEIFQSLPASIQATDRVQLLKAQIALELGFLDEVEPVFEWEFAVIREGQTLLSDLWFELQAHRLSAKTGQALTPELRQKVRAEYKPPAHIDFRSVDEA